MSKNILKMIEEMNTKIAELKDEVKKNGTQGLAEIAKDVFNQVEGLRKFVIVGYTPGFNDGEPCYHSSFYGIGGYHYAEHWRDKGTYYVGGDEVAEHENWEEFFEIDEFPTYPEPIVYANSGVKDQDKAYRLIGQLDDVCEVLYGTNYEVRVTLNDDGSVGVQVDDYDCGY